MDTSEAKSVPELVEHDISVNSQVRQLTTGITNIDSTGNIIST